MPEINVYKLNRDEWEAEYIDDVIKITTKGCNPDEARTRLIKILDNAKVMNGKSNN